MNDNTIYLIRDTINGTMIYFNNKEETDKYLENMELTKGEIFEKYEINKGKNNTIKPNIVKFVAYYSTTRYDVGIVSIAIIDQDKVVKTNEFPSFKNNIGRKFVFTLELYPNETKDALMVRAKNTAEELLEKEYNSNENFKEYVNKQILESEGVI